MPKGKASTQAYSFWLDENGVLQAKFRGLTASGTILKPEEAVEKIREGPVRIAASDVREFQERMGMDSLTLQTDEWAHRMTSKWVKEEGKAKATVFEYPKPFAVVEWVYLQDPIVKFFDTIDEAKAWAEGFLIGLE